MLIWDWHEIGWTDGLVVPNGYVERVEIEDDGEPACTVIIQRRVIETYGRTARRVEMRGITATANPTATTPPTTIATITPGASARRCPPRSQLGATWST